MSQLQQYIDSMRDLFSTDGWLLLLDELTGLEEQYTNFDAISTEQQLNFAKGVVFAARQISSLPQQVRDAEEEMAEDA
jgi:hypothetical protein